MKHLKKFENFYLSPDVDSDEQEFIDYSNNLRSVAGRLPKELEDDHEESSADNVSELPDEYSDELRTVVAGGMTEDDELSPEGNDEEEGDYEKGDNYDSSEEEEGDRFIKRFDEAKKSKSVSYKKSGLKRPDLADRNKNKKIEGWEKAIAKKIEKSIEKKKK
jgi:hypothetical protein